MTWCQHLTNKIHTVSDRRKWTFLGSAVCRKSISLRCLRIFKYSTVFFRPIFHDCTMLSFINTFQSLVHGLHRYASQMLPTKWQISFFVFAAFAYITACFQVKTFAITNVANVTGQCRLLAYSTSPFPNPFQFRPFFSCFGTFQFGTFLFLHMSSSRTVVINIFTMKKIACI